MSCCVSCSHALSWLRRYEFKSKAFRQVYRDGAVYFCTVCGLNQVDVSKIDDLALTQYYRSTYRPLAMIGIGDAGHGWYRARATALADLAVEFMLENPKRIFEVGAGYGYNLSALKARFPNALLLTDELDESIHFPETISRASLADGPYDVVILSHVLEHFTDPKRLIASALKSLAKDGFVVIEVPNDVPGIFPMNGPDEPHLTFFTERTLNALLGGTSAYAVGPPYQSKNLYTHIRRFASRVLTRTPVLSSLIRKRRAMVISAESFGVRRANGIFLRAVLHNYN
jgi:2-polyprenyl-3-methyl-5-hydroxy-6-metoxy-1,4-benzoquinol methylase